jgi:DNA repair exonuclease SbcCD ATPase subunit
MSSSQRYRYNFSSTQQEQRAEKERQKRLEEERLRIEEENRRLEELRRRREAQKQTAERLRKELIQLEQQQDARSSKLNQQLERETAQKRDGNKAQLEQKLRTADFEHSQFQDHCSKIESELQSLSEKVAALETMKPTQFAVYRALELTLGERFTRALQITDDGTVLVRLEQRLQEALEAKVIAATIPVPDNEQKTFHFDIEPGYAKSEECETLASTVRLGLSAEGLSAEYIDDKGDTTARKKIHTFQPNTLPASSKNKG